MFRKPKKDKRSSIDREIDDVIQVMSILEKDSVQYTKMAANLAVLMEGRSHNKESNKVSKDAIVTGVFSLLGILIIVLYEDAHTLGSKAVGFVIKGRG